MTVELNIKQAVFHELSLLAAIEIPIVAAGMVTEPPDSGQYINLVWLPNPSRRMTIKSRSVHQYRGVLRVDVVWPKNSGVNEPMLLAGLISEYFYSDRYIVNYGVAVRITKSPDVGRFFEKDNSLTVPVFIEWECFH